jgi:SAM-dependent methyltransferase
MHPTAYKNCVMFFTTHCKDFSNESLVIDFGSYDVNGTLKPIFKDFKYIGLDMSAGPNVDIVCNNSEVPLENESADIVVSSSSFEHDDCFWETFLEMLRILKPNGLLYINAPSEGVYHGYPGDCWRFYADSWKALEKYGNRKGYNNYLVETYIDQGCNWKNSVGIFRKVVKVKSEQEQ